ncbi:Transposase from transposon Tn916 [Pseudoclavibacter triregionum]|nr:Transposase from transposon Tn916 [Pseudoclavibacter triregionum]
MTTTKRRANGEGSTPTQRKDGRWQVHVRYRDTYGVSKRTTAYGATPSEATANAKKIRDRLEEGLPARDARTTVAAFASAWIDSALAASDRKETTKSLYETVTKKHIMNKKIGTVTLDALKPSHVEAWVVQLRKDGLADSTVRTCYTVLRSILDTAVRDEALAKNPVAAIKRPTVARKEAAHLTTLQVRQLLSAASSSRYAPLFELLVNTGLRRGEALALTWRDIDFERSVIRVRGTLARIDGDLVVTDAKTEKSKRFIHMSPAAERVFKEVRLRQKEERLKAGSVWVSTNFVFTTETGEPCDPRNALRALQAAAKKAGLEGIGLHTLRHSAATVMIENGVPLKIVSEILGHSSVAITGDVYGHVSPEVAADALDALGTALGA